MVSFVQPYTKDDLERGEKIVQQLHGLKGYDAWAERIAKEIAVERNEADRLRVALQESEAARCKMADFTLATVGKLRDALREARTWFLLPANVDLNGSDRVYRIVDDALGTQYRSSYDVPLSGDCGTH